jgi:metal-dependent amidase/aminoacylase/carboxypeptidase family protein
MVHAGEATNVVPDSVELQGTVRTFTLEVLDLIERRMEEVVRGTCAAHGVQCTFEFVRNYPPTINTAPEADFARRVMAEVVGEANALPRSLPWAPRTLPSCCWKSPVPTASSPTATATTAPWATAAALHLAQPQLRLQRRADPAVRPSGCCWPSSGWSSPR